MAFHRAATQLPQDCRYDREWLPLIKCEEKKLRCSTNPLRLLLTHGPLGAERVPALASLPSERQVSGPSGRPVSLLMTCCAHRGGTCFFPQKEFPEILGGSNKFLALQLIHSILVSEPDSPRSIHFTNLLGSHTGVALGV